MGPCLTGETHMFNSKISSGFLVFALATVGASGAQTLISLPDTSQTTTLTSNVSEQARGDGSRGRHLQRPPTSPAAPRRAPPRSPSATSCWPPPPSSSRSPSRPTPRTSPRPSPARPPGEAGDVTWNAASWTNATGASGTLTDLSYSAVATCGRRRRGPAHTTALIFSLGAKSTVKRSGNHTLSIQWKFASIGA